MESPTPPTAHEIAARAGVSNRLIFHHFEDMDALHRRVGDKFVEHFGDLAPVVPPDLPLATRIERTTRGRARVYEALGNLGTNAAALAPHHPGIAAGTVAAQRMLMEFLETTFAPELDAASGPLRRELLAALDASSCWPVWDRLRRVDGLSVTSSRRVMTRMMRAALIDV